eukprot:jgi/Galph1/2465/GphlegSOOS_G1102.1
MQEEFMQQALHDMTSEEEKINKEKEALEEEEKSSLQEQLSIYETIIQEIRARLSQLTLTRTHSSNANKENEEGEKAELEDRKEFSVVGMKIVHKPICFQR